MDTTLRDGEQMQGISYSPVEKLHIAAFLLKEVKVDRIEVASARVSTGEIEALKMITRWARRNNFQDKVEVLGFIDGDISINWIHDAGGKVINLLCKGSLRHLEKQLRKTPEQHVNDIKGIIKLAGETGMDVNIYLEDWSNGMISSEDYVFHMLDSLRDERIARDLCFLIHLEFSIRIRHIPSVKRWSTDILHFILISIPITTMIWQLPISILR